MDSVLGNSFSIIRNRSGRDFVVGDLHGAVSDALRYLLRDIAFDPGA